MTLPTRVSSLLTLTAALMLVIASCGKKEETTTTTTQTATPPAGTTAEPQTPVTGGTPADTGTTAATTAAPVDTAHAVSFTGKAAAGQKIFYNASFGTVKVACAGCHSDRQQGTNDVRIRTGANLAGVVSRTATWNGLVKGAELKSRAYGADICAAVYQKRAEGNIQKALAPADIDALNEYFTAISALPGANPKNIAIQWVTKPQFTEDESIDDKAAKPAAKAILKLPGEAGKGQAFFTRSCVYCHSIKEKKIGPSLADAFGDAEYVAKTLRVGSGAMPFYTKDIATDQQLADVIAYIQEQIGK